MGSVFFAMVTHFVTCRTSGVDFRFQCTISLQLYPIRFLVSYRGCQFDTVLQSSETGHPRWVTVSNNTWSACED